MKIANYYNNNDVRIEEVPIPAIGKGEILIKTEAMGICGSDVMEWYRTAKTPRVLGHEVTGVVVKIGEGIVNLKEGDRVAASHHVPCYDCHYCRLGHQTLCETLRTTNFDPGGFAEWIRLPEINSRYGVYKLPENVSFEEGTLIEPLACTLRGQKKAGVRKEQTVLVIGCGPSGLLHILLAKALGAKRIIGADINDFRLEAARRLGADMVLRSDESLIHNRLKESNEGRLADIVIVCAGNRQATVQALESVGRGGTVLFFALQSPKQVIPLPMNDLFWKKGVTLMSTYAASPEDHREALDLITSGQIKVTQMISHRMGFSEIERGFQMVAKAEESLKVIIQP